MRAALWSRQPRLVNRPGRAQAAIRLLLGPLRKPPADYTGKRPVVITKREPSDFPNRQKCEFEERPGLGPDLEVSDNAMVIFFVIPPESVPA
jgi:hypothetical protein